jgi:putative ABC transport system ATP-binding protein
MDAAKPLIQIRQLSKIYQMGETEVRALDGVDLEINAGEFVSITGASGSGKSTMMHLLGCLDRPTAGEFWFRGDMVSKFSDRRLAAVRNKHIGFVFQTFNLVNRTTAIDNVALPLVYGRKSLTRQSAKKALERVGLAPRAGHQPSQLSGGERQRVAIARAIVNDPDVILADEPTGNLDTKTGDQIMQIFHELNAAGKTIILVTHEMDVAVQAKRLIQMVDGKIVADRRIDENIKDELLRNGLSRLAKTASTKQPPASLDDDVDTLARGAIDPEVKPHEDNPNDVEPRVSSRR